MSQPGADASSQKFLGDVELQLLQSDLTDSMLGGTGLPIYVTQSEHRAANSRLEGTPILVEIAAMTEIAHSAYQLDQIRAAREERMRLGQTDDDEEGEGDLEVEGEGPMPKYPRGMLKFELSDGTTTLSAVEYRPLHDIVLGRTPLGFKMLLKNPILRCGIAFLEPDTVELLGYQTADREVHQRTDFARGLRARMGLPLEPIEEPENDPEQQQQLVPPQNPPVPARSPLREISPPPELPINSTYNDDENLEPRRRKLPSTNTTAVTTQASTAVSATLVGPSHSGTTASRYFNANSSTASSSNTNLGGLNLGLTTAQASQAPARDNVPDDNDEDLYSQFNGSVSISASAYGPDENAPPPSQPTKPPSQQLSNTGPTRPTMPSSLASSMTLPSSSSSTSTATAGASNATSNANVKAKRLQAIQRALAAEPSIEIISFTPSQAQIVNNNNKGKNKEISTSRRSSSTPGIDSDRLELDAQLLKDLDEVEALRFADPEFKKQQEEEFGRISGAGGGGGRPIKPLPRPRKSLNSSQQSASSQPNRSQANSQNHSQTSSRSQSLSQSNEVIEIDSDSDSISRKPKPPRAKPQVSSQWNQRVDVDLFNDDDDDFMIDAELEDEQYDKENMPVMTRHVRRKVASSDGATLSGGLFGNHGRGGGGTSGEVIELSDED
ncbi:RecQ-mediated genome instability protein 1 [Leucoagaricus sp. SymC.cos]|nr:RecQ-mediated genome instability protein 1 [Leucoagaricus sp. SymC.cos]